MDADELPPEKSFAPVPTRHGSTHREIDAEGAGGGGVVGSQI